MKIWKKIFLYTLILFVIVFNGAGIIVIESIYDKNINIAIKTALHNEKDIINSIYLNSDLLQIYENYENYDNYESYIGDKLWTILKNYIYSESNEVKNIEIFNDNNEEILKTSNLNLGYTPKDFENLSFDEFNFIIKTVDNKKYISMICSIKLRNSSFKVLMSKDISYVVENKYYNYKIFVLLSLIVTLILAIGLYLISKKITNPIESLTEVSNSIKKGDYNKRASYYKNDEIGILAQNFNSMMSVIELNISELKNVNAEKQLFIDTLTHEMKTPITSIIGYSDLLLKSNVNDEIKFKALSYINSQGHRLENLNLSLIKLIMIRNKNIEISKLNINEIVKDSISGLIYNLEEKSITVIKNITNSTIVGDKELIGILLKNILDNSIKASSNNSTIEVIGCALDDNLKYELIIKDTGIGISEEDLNKIKKPFYMVDKARSNSENNMGLGLSICTDICSLNNIEFKINSKLNKGTIVTLIFSMESIDYEK